MLGVQRLPVRRRTRKRHPDVHTRAGFPPPSEPGSYRTAPVRLCDGAFRRLSEAPDRDAGPY